MASKKKNKRSSQAIKPQQRSESPKPQIKKIGSAKSLFPGKWQINLLIFLLFVIATVILYSADLHIGFFRIDDKQYVINDPWIRGITSENISYILSHPYFVNYSPMHLFSYMIDYAIGGSDAYGFHLSSNIWAGIIAGFVYLVTLALAQKRIIAIATAALFVVHPVHVEAIAWISSRKDLVATAFILPSFLAYLKYRNTKSKWWYSFSVLLFLFSVSGKLSVATFPAVLVAYDLFVEKRNFIRSLIDKTPFLIIAIIISMAVANAQPSTGGHIDFGVLAKALAQSVWLLTGFGTYVIYHVPPQPDNILATIIGAIILLVVFLFPLLLREKFPLTVVLIYWILMAYLPTQILSFAYPVTDRYLFLPSVAVCILIAYGLYEIMKRKVKWKLVAASVLFVVIFLFWTKNTYNYLNEWKDPRSVWYAAQKKSSDVQVHYNLGWQYMDKAATFGIKRRKAPLPLEDEKKFASLVWENDPKLPDLLNELNTNKHNGPVEEEFKKYLQTLALNDLDEAVKRKGKNIMGEMFFHRGMLKIDMGDLQGAKKEFLSAITEVSRSNYEGGQQEVLVNCHYNLAIAEWTLGNYKEALPWIKLAEDEQNKFGQVWFSDLTDNRKKLEQIIASLPKQ